MKVKASGNFDDDSRDVDRLISELASIHMHRPEQKWRLSLREVEYLGPWAVALIAATVLRGRLMRQEPRVSLPTEPPELGRYCAASGLGELVGASFTPTDVLADAIELSVVKTATWNDSMKVVEFVRRHRQLSEPRAEILRICVSEILQNIQDHARSEIGGVLTARFMSGVGRSDALPEVRIGLVDTGVGVLGSLKPRYPALRTSYEAIGRIVIGETSAKSRPNNLGLGVSNLFLFVRAHQGKVAFVSDNAVWQSFPQKPEPHGFEMKCSWPGTAVFFSLPVDG
jgi:hypothetical protein